jgi:hypothetical protein
MISASSFFRQRAALTMTLTVTALVFAGRLPPPARAESRLEKLPGSLMALPLLNGPEVRRALADLSLQTLPSAGWLEDQKGRALAGVTFVGVEGYFITKASEVVRLDDCRLRPRPGESSLAVREIRREVKLDLALGQVISTSNVPIIVKPVTWAPSAGAGLGHWLVSPALTALEQGQEGVPHFELNLGVLSAARRPIPGMGAALGITGRPADKGLHITSVAAESPARTAGLRENDILLEIAGQPAPSIPEVNAIIQKRQPGDEVQIKVLRQGKEFRKQVRLASRSRVVANWEGDDYANGGISIRTDDFPEVIQHDMPLYPHDMGGPVFDLKGRAIAVNMARADRITTFALPMERFRDTLEKWLEADRHPPAAEKVNK